MLQEKYKLKTINNTDREILAVINAINAFRLYLGFKEFTVRTKAERAGKIRKFKLQIQNLELLFTTLFKFSSYYSNSRHYSKYQVLFKFGI